MLAKFAFKNRPQARALARTYPLQRIMYVNNPLQINICSVKRKNNPINIIQNSLKIADIGICNMHDSSTFINLAIKIKKKKFD